MNGILLINGLPGFVIKLLRPIFQGGGVIADIGCGREAAFLKYYSSSVLKGFGFDFRIEDQTIKNLTLINNKGSDGLDIESCCCDTVFMLAVLEHLDTTKVLLNEIHRILKPGGKFCLTTPTPAAKPVLECMAALHIINREEILEHKHYYSGQEIHTLMEDCGFACDQYKKFCFGMNSMAVGTCIPLSTEGSDRGNIC